MTTAGYSVELLRAAVRAAIRAPSMYNGQPWRFRLREDAIEVHIDPYRLLPVADPHRWATRIACGAAIANMRIALAAAGRSSSIRILPDDHDPLHVATLALTGEYGATPKDRALRRAIDERHSNRQPFFDTPVPTDARARLQLAAESAGAHLALVSERREVGRLAQIIRDADRRLRADAAYVAEMQAWIGHHVIEESGIPPSAAGLAPAGQDLLTMRDYGGAPRSPYHDFESDPLLGVLSVPTGSPRDDVLAGSALQVVLLTATVDRLASSMLSQPVEDAAGRAELQRVVRHGIPSMVIRLGYGEAVGASPRRPLGAVVD